MCIIEMSDDFQLMSNSIDKIYIHYNMFQPNNRFYNIVIQ